MSTESRGVGQERSEDRGIVKEGLNVAGVGCNLHCRSELVKSHGVVALPDRQMGAELVEFEAVCRRDLRVSHRERQASPSASSPAAIASRVRMRCSVMVVAPSSIRSLQFGSATSAPATITREQREACAFESDSIGEVSGDRGSGGRQTGSVEYLGSSLRLPPRCQRSGEHDAGEDACGDFAESIEAVDGFDDALLRRFDVAAFPGGPCQGYRRDCRLRVSAEPVLHHQVTGANRQRLSCGEIATAVAGVCLHGEGIGLVAKNRIVRGERVVEPLLEHLESIGVPLMQEEHLAGCRFDPPALAGLGLLRCQRCQGEVEVAGSVGDRRVDGADEFVGVLVKREWDEAPEMGISGCFLFGHGCEDVSGDAVQTVDLDSFEIAEERREQPRRRNRRSEAG